MVLQSMFVGTLVAGCTGYSVWSVLPAAGRRAMSNLLLRLPLPARLRGPFVRATQNVGGCGCDGCDRSGAGKTSVRPAEAVIKIQRRPR